MKKQRVERIWIDGVSLTELIEKLQAAVKDFGSDGTYLSIELEEDYGSPYVETCIVYTTEETAEEQETRAAREARIAGAVLEDKRKQYEALKKEFE